jgi:hypothetical protein
MILHTVGDSHALYGWPMLIVPGYEIRCHHLGAKLMHTVTKGDLDAGLAHVRDQLLPGDAICFCFGEIDCRAHAHTHGLDGLVQKYMNHLAWLMEPAPPGLRLVMGPVPPQREPRAVHAGSAEERRAYAQFMNHELWTWAPVLGFRHVNVFSAYSDDQGFLRTELAGNRGHIGDHMPLQAVVRKVLA